MKNNRSLMIIATAVLIILLLSLGLFMHFNQSVTFDKAIGKDFDSKSVNSIEIIKRDTTGEKIVDITDPNQIQQVLAVFSDLKLKKSRISEVQFENSYWITLKGYKQQRSAGITLYDGTYLDVYNYGSNSPKNVQTSYKIVSDVDLNELIELFKS